MAIIESFFFFLKLFLWAPTNGIHREYLCIRLRTKRNETSDGQLRYVVTVVGSTCVVAKSCPSHRRPPPETEQRYGRRRTNLNVASCRSRVLNTRNSGTTATSATNASDAQRCSGGKQIISSSMCNTLRTISIDFRKIGFIRRNGR